MEKYVVTGLNAAYWDVCAPCWLGSLKTLAAHQGDVLVLDMGDLTEVHKARLAKLGAKVVGANGGYLHHQLNQFQAIADLARDQPGYYAYWAPDCYFQGPVDEVFDLDGLSFCVNDSSVPTYVEGGVRQYRTVLAGVIEQHGGLADCSFVAGDGEAWEEFMRFCRYAVDHKLVGVADGIDSLLLNSFAAFFPAVARVRPNVWNSKVCPALRWDGSAYALGGEPAKVVQPGLEAVNYFDLKEYSFQERHKNLHRDWHGALVKGHAPSPKLNGRRMVFREKPRADVGQRPEGAVEAAGV